MTHCNTAAIMVLLLGKCCLQSRFQQCPDFISIPYQNVMQQAVQHWNIVPGSCTAALPGSAPGNVSYFYMSSVSPRGRYTEKRETAAHRSLQLSPCNSDSRQKGQNSVVTGGEGSLPFPAAQQARINPEGKNYVNFMLCNIFLLTQQSQEFSDGQNNSSAIIRSIE